MAAAELVQSSSRRLRLGHAASTPMLAHPIDSLSRRRGIMSPLRGGSAVDPPRTMTAASTSPLLSEAARNRTNQRRSRIDIEEPSAMRSNHAVALESAPPPRLSLADGLPQQPTLQRASAPDSRQKVYQAARIQVSTIR
jgi:hypothetical protein